MTSPQLRPDGILCIRPAPVRELAESLARIEQLGRMKAQLPSKLMLLDLRGQGSTYGPMVNVLLAHHMAEHLQGIRVAVLVDKRVGLAERTAQKMALDLWAFEDEDEAVAWLLDG